MVFLDTDPPPFYDPDCPKFDTNTGVMKRQKVKGPKAKATTLRQMAPRADAEHVESDEREVEDVRLGYVGKPKGFHVHALYALD